MHIDRLPEIYYVRLVIAPDCLSSLFGRGCCSTGGLEPDREGPPLAASFLQEGFQRIDGRWGASKVASAKYRTPHSVWRTAGRETSLSTRENKDLIRRYFEAIDRPNASPDILDQFLDPEIVAHDPVPGFSGDLGG